MLSRYIDIFSFVSLFSISTVPITTPTSISTTPTIKVEYCTYDGTNYEVSFCCCNVNVSTLNVGQHTAILVHVYSYFVVALQSAGHVMIDYDSIEEN